MTLNNCMYSGLSRQEAEREKGEAAWQRAFEDAMSRLENDFYNASDKLDLVFSGSDKSLDTRPFAERLMALAFALKNTRSDEDMRLAKSTAKEIIYDMAEYLADK